MRKIKNHHLLLGCAFGAQLLCATKGYSNKIEYADANRNGKVSYRYENAGKKFSGKENVISSNNVQEKISGKVTGPDGKGIAGVSVQIKGARGGVISGAGGEFTVDA